MTEQKLQELNKKLAEWAGINPIPMEKIYYDHSTEIVEDLPNFTQSLDACFKWLVPKLNLEEDELYGITFTYNQPDGGITCSVATEKKLSQAQGGNSALALCLAIEKLIDGEKNA